VTFIVVSWTNGDTITEVKLDQMIANDEHLREEADHKVLATSGPATSGAHGSNSPTFGLTYGSGVTGAGAKSETNIDVSSLTDGTAYVVTASGNGFTSFSFLFIKTPDINKLSYWVTLASVYDDPNYILSAGSFTLIGHRSNY